jgi:hypothetical protein
MDSAREVVVGDVDRVVKPSRRDDGSKVLLEEDVGDVGMGVGDVDALHDWNTLSVAIVGDGDEGLNGRRFKVMFNLSNARLTDATPAMEGQTGGTKHPAAVGTRGVLRFYSTRLQVGSEDTSPAEHACAIWALELFILVRAGLLRVRDGTFTITRRQPGCSREGWLRVRLMIFLVCLLLGFVALRRRLFAICRDNSGSQLHCRCHDI